MELDFGTIAPRLRTIGLHITIQEQNMIDAAFPWLLHEFSLEHVQYFGKIYTLLPDPYLIVRGFREAVAIPVFLVSINGVDWTELPLVDEKVLEALDAIDYGLTCQRPFTGKLMELLPRPEGEEEEEEPEEQEEQEEQGEDQGEEGEEAAPIKKEPKPKKEKPIKPTEAHRLSVCINEIQAHLQLIIPAAYSKRGSQPARNATFRGLTAASSKSIAIKSEYLAFLESGYRGTMEDCPTIADYPNSFIYPSTFDPITNCLIVSSRFWPGCIYYVFARTLIWGSAYEGTGLINCNVHLEM